MEKSEKIRLRRVLDHFTMKRCDQTPLIPNIFNQRTSPRLGDMVVTNLASRYHPLSGSPSPSAAKDHCQAKVVRENSDEDIPLCGVGGYSLQRRRLGLWALGRHLHPQPHWWLDDGDKGGCGLTIVWLGGHGDASICSRFACGLRLVIPVEHRLVARRWLLPPATCLCGGGDLTLVSLASLRC
jgi:hypothetical protein